MSFIWESISVNVNMVSKAAVGAVFMVPVVSMHTSRWILVSSFRFETFSAAGWATISENGSENGCVYPVIGRISCQKFCRILELKRRLTISLFFFEYCLSMSVFGPRIFQNLKLTSIEFQDPEHRYRHFVG